MGTRGFVGFVADGTEKIAYNHFDSYPDGLGLDILFWLRNALTTHGDVLVRQIKALRVIARDSEPTDADIKQLKAFYNPNVGGRGERPTWYQLLRGTQGDPAAMVRAGVIEDASDFPGDSLFAEYGYVIDVDARTFEAYRGFQREPHDKGRFAARPPRNPLDREYYPVALVASWSLDDLPDNDAFLAAFENEAAAR